MSVVQISIPDHKMEIFLPKNKLCLCRGAITPCNLQFATALHQHQDIAMLNKQSHQQSNHCLSRHSRLQWRTAFCLRLIVSKNYTKSFTNNIVLRYKYYAYCLHGHRCYVRTYSCQFIKLYYHVVQ